MERGEAPPAGKVRFLRSEGKSYRWIAEKYGISVEEAYRLGHEDELRDDAARRLERV